MPGICPTITNTASTTYKRAFDFLGVAGGSPVVLTLQVLFSRIGHSTYNTGTVLFVDNFLDMASKDFCNISLYSLT